MLEGFIAFLVLLYAAFHAGHGLAGWRHSRRNGRGVSLYWHLGRGPWVTIPGPFGTRIGHRL